MGCGLKIPGSFFFFSLFFNRHFVFLYDFFSWLLNPSIPHILGRGEGAGGGMSRVSGWLLRVIFCDDFCFLFYFFGFFMIHEGFTFCLSMIHLDWFSTKRRRLVTGMLILSFIDTKYFLGRTPNNPWFSRESGGWIRKWREQEGAGEGREGGQPKQPSCETACLYHKFFFFFPFLTSTFMFCKQCILIRSMGFSKIGD